MDRYVVVRLDGAALLWIGCALDGTVAPELHRVLQGLLDTGAVPLVVDLVDVPHLDDGGIAVLAAGVARAAQFGAGIELRLRGGHAALVTEVSALRPVLGRAFPAAA